MMMNINENIDTMIEELADDALEEVSGGRHVQATGNNVRIRTAPSTTAGIIGKLGKGDRVTYTGEKVKDKHHVTWYRVKYNGTTGWISGKYAKLL